MWVVVALTLVTAVGDPQPPAAGSSDGAAPNPASVTRVRRALERAPRSQLTLPERKPDYRIEVEGSGSHPFFTPLPDIDFGGGSGPRAPSLFAQMPQLGTTRPLIGIDLLVLERALNRSIGNASRARAEKAAREEVLDALAEFCATHVCPPP